jgi:hypothetical protein
MSGSFEVSATHGRTHLFDRKAVHRSGRHGLVRAAARATADATLLIARCVPTGSSTSLSGGSYEPDSSPTTQ